MEKVRTLSEHTKQTIYTVPKSTHESRCITAPEPVWATPILELWAKWVNVPLNNQMISTETGCRKD